MNYNSDSYNPYASSITQTNLNHNRKRRHSVIHRKQQLLKKLHILHRKQKRLLQQHKQIQYYKLRFGCNEK
uniref:Uncharacterized protein n=1 Tax=viral metagenome TaxID=1070528 RepID=A0A6C0CT61_9ZZZZ